MTVATQPLLDDAQATVLYLFKTSTDYIDGLPENARSLLDELKEIQTMLNALQVKCKLKCLEIETKYYELQRPLLDRLQGLVAGKSHASSASEEIPDSPVVGIPNFWRTVLSNHLGFHDMIEEHDRDVLGHLVDIRIEYDNISDTSPSLGYKILFEFSPNDYFEDRVLSKSYYYDRENIGLSGDLVYLSAAGTKIDWKKGMDLTQRVDGSYRGSFFEFFAPLTREEIEEAEMDDEWLEVIQDDIEYDYQLGAALKDEILPRAFDWFTGRPFAAARIPTALPADGREAVAFPTLKHEPKYGYKRIMQDASPELARSLLFLAAQRGYVGVVKLLLGRDDIDVNTEDEEGRTPLFFAAREGQEGMVRFLASQDKVELDHPKKNNVTPLYIAAQNNHLEIVRFLVAQPGVDVNSTIEDGANPLFVACQNGHRDVVNLLVGVEGINLNPRFKDGSTAFFIAAQNGHEAVVKLLAGVKGVEIDAQNDEGRTPLFIAAREGREPIVEFLVGQVGVDINKPNQGGATPFYVAAQNGHDGVVKLLAGQPAILVNACTVDGATPLYIAAQNGREEVAKVLVALDGVDLNAQWKDGSTPLYIAAQNRHEAIVKLLLGQDKIEINLAKKNGVTPLYAATQSGVLNIVKLLVNAPGINLNSVAEGGTTPLYVASYMGHEEIVEFLLSQKGVEVNPPLSDGASALYAAAERGHEGVVRLLVEVDGIDLKAKFQGTTPHSIAVQRGHTAISTLIEQAKTTQAKGFTWTLGRR